jgi:hypothetical protein
MLEGRQALDLALDLARKPALAPVIRGQPLPPDTLVLIRLAAGCEETGVEAAQTTGVPKERLREAATLYLKMVLLHPGCDSYRILGVLPKAPRGQMREHMRWLVRWLHPDRNNNGPESAFVQQVLAAWREVERDGRKPSEPARRQPSPRQRKLASRPAQRWIELPLKKEPIAKWKKSHRLAAVMFTLVLMVSVVSAVTLISADTPMLNRLTTLGSKLPASD